MNSFNRFWAGAAATLTLLWIISLVVFVSGCTDNTKITTTEPMACSVPDAGPQDAAPSMVELKEGHKYVVATTSPEPCDCSECLDCTVGVDGQTPSGRPWAGCRIFCAPLDNQTCIDCGACVTQPQSIECAEQIRLEAAARGGD